MAVITTSLDLENMALSKEHLKRFWPLYVLLYFIFGFLKTKFFSPLSQYPGPFMAGFTDLWKVKTTLSKKQHLIYLEQHKKYGPVFRDGPFSLSYCDPVALKKIYGFGKEAFPRANSFFPSGVNPEHPPVFFAMTPNIHKKTKQKVASAYSMTSILQLENLIDEMIILWKTQLLNLADKKPVDFSKWSNYLTADVVSKLAYGQEFGFLKIGGDVDGILEALQAGFEFFTLATMAPIVPKILFSDVMQKLVPLSTKSGFGAILKRAADIVDDRYQNGSKNRPIHRDQLRGEVLASLIAGADTTSNSIMGIVGFLMKNSRACRILQKELDVAYATSKPRRSIISYLDASKLPYLNACISEGLRLSPAVANIFTREVPAGGAIIIGNESVPAGTTVGVNNWVMGRNKEIYGEDADEFIPERWLDVDNAKRYRDLDFAFGYGARVCVGRNLAMVEIYKAIFEIFRTFNITQANQERLWIEEAKLFLYKSDMMVTLTRRT